MIIAEGINDAWLQVLKQLDEEGVHCSPRGKFCKELLNVSVRINNPKKRLLSLPVRSMSLPYAFGEFVWYLSGSNKLDVMQYYSSTMKFFSDDGETLNSAYGHRIFGNHPDIAFNQWSHVVRLLLTDNSTRQAIIHLHTPSKKKTKDEVCTLNLQFLIRNGKLDMIVNMRSNDIILGFTYDVFAFTSLQELMANELGFEVGVYYHNAASMHIYEKDFRYFGDTLNQFNNLMYMTQYDTEFDYQGMIISDYDFGQLMFLEAAIRTNGAGVHYDLVKNKTVRVMIDVFRLYYVYRSESADQVLPLLEYDNIYHCMMRSFIHRKRFMHESNLVIVEGCDGAGKTTYAVEEGALYGFDVIHFKKPTSSFNKLIYFNIALMTGDIMLDRYFYSEIVYSAFYNRQCMLSDNDIIVLENLLNFRWAKIKLLSTSNEECFERLNVQDRATFCENDIEVICSLYKLTFNESSLFHKEVI